MPAVRYRREVVVPEGWKDERVLLHFGAVDYDAKVWVNGQSAGAHRGGYVPFSYDITGLLREGKNELAVGVLDDTRDTLVASGKQAYERESSGCFYTRSTGIWQTVWLEPVPQAYLAKMRVYPDLDGGQVTIWAVSYTHLTLPTKRIV